MNAEQAATKSPTVRIVLWVVFLVSLAVFVITLGFVLTSRPQTGGPPQGTVGDTGASLTTVVTAVASLVTSLATLAGIAMGWKKQSIETAKAEIEIARLRLELEQDREAVVRSKPSE